MELPNWNTPLIPHLSFPLIRRCYPSLHSAKQLLFFDTRRRISNVRDFNPRARCLSSPAVQTITKGRMPFRKRWPINSSSTVGEFGMHWIRWKVGCKMCSLKQKAGKRYRVGGRQRTCPAPPGAAESAATLLRQHAYWI